MLFTVYPSLLGAWKEALKILVNVIPNYSPAGVAGQFPKKGNSVFVRRQGMLMLIRAVTKTWLSLKRCSAVFRMEKGNKKRKKDVSPEGWAEEKWEGVNVDGKAVKHCWALWSCQFSEHTQIYGETWLFRQTSAVSNCIFVLSQRAESCWVWPCPVNTAEVVLYWQQHEPDLLTGPTLL